MLCWNRAFWLAKTSPLTFNSQSECFISAFCSYATLNFVHDISSCLLFWVAKIETSHILQDNKDKHYKRHSLASLFMPCHNAYTEDTHLLCNGKSITVQLTSCLNGLDSVALIMFNEQQIYLFGQIQTSQTGGQPYRDTSPYSVLYSTLFITLVTCCFYDRPRSRCHLFVTLPVVKQDWRFQEKMELFDS